MKNSPMILFDFDGTIADTLPLFVGIYNHIAPEFGCKTVRPEEQDQLRGKRPQEFMRDYGVTWWNMPRLVNRARQELKKHIKDIQLQRGMAEAIQSLSEAGYRLGIMTSNSKENTETILRRFGLNDVFEIISSSKHIFGKHRVLRRIARSVERAVVYVGDETRDVEAAKRAGLPVVAVGWGFNKPEALRSVQPDAFVSSPVELPQTVQQLV